MKTHHDLEIWKNAVNFVTKIYAITEQYPKQELFGLTNQMRRAAVSIPSNIAEGAARNYDSEFVRFLYISQGSLSEIETQLIISLNLGYITKEKLDEIINDVYLIRSQISGLIKFKKKAINQEN
jgi:four helix bundle protein